MTLQQIKDEIHNIKVIELPLHSPGEDYDQLKTAMDRLENIVNQYKPPTCASCNHLTRFQHKHKNNGRCNAMGKKLGSIEISDHLTIRDVDYFGCIHHSDYERK